MTTIRTVFRVSSKDPCEGTLFFRIIHKRKMRQVHSGCKIQIAEWDDESGKVKIRGDDERTAYLRSVQTKLDCGMARLKRITNDLDNAGIDYSVSDIAERYHLPDSTTGFISYARKHIAELRQIGKVRKAEHYSTSLNSFMRFNGAGEISFDQFSGILIQRYEHYLAVQGLLSNSISYYMRNLRAIYNQAVEQGHAEQTNPFRYVYTGIAKTVKRALSLSTVKTLRSMDLSHDSLSELARDLFMFSFYTRGMAIIDVAYLRKSNLKNGTLIYRRHKTGQQLSIRWEPQMQEIVNRHSDKDSDFLLPIIDSRKLDYRKQYHNAYTRLNRSLKGIGTQLGLSSPLTFHRSRHSWASIARDNNIPLSVICEGMGHDSEKTTRIYLASLASSVVDRANRDIMKLLE